MNVYRLVCFCIGKTETCDLRDLCFVPAGKNTCIYLKLKITLIFTLTLLLETGSKGFSSKEHFVLDVKLELHLKLCAFLDI